jgi:hypothetical protein
MSRNQQEENRSSRIPENDPSKAMDSKKEVDQSPDEKTDQDFPGYPHYPAKEDIMDQRTDSHRVDVDVENIPSNKNITGVSQRFQAGQNRGNSGDMESDEDNRDSDGGMATEDTLQVSDSRNAEIGTPQNVSNEDLNNDQSLPGSDLQEEA